MSADIDTTGWIAQERGAYAIYTSVVRELASKPRLSFYDARRLIDAYAAWVEIFDPPRARSHVAFLQKEIVRREWSGAP